MATHIELDQTKRLGLKARMMVDEGRQFLGDLRAMKSICDTLVVAGTPNDYTALEAALGLTIGQGGAVYYLFVNSQTAVDVPNLLALLDQLG